jgi:hypothetical protein
VPVPMKPGSPKNEHYEYVRNGTCCVLVAIDPHEGKRLLRVMEHRTRFEYYYTPKKWSWLNMAEIELSALSKQCLDRRIGDIDTLTKETSMWAQERNAKKATIKWKFTKNDARSKLNRHYITLQN